MVHLSNAARLDADPSSSLSSTPTLTRSHSPSPTPSSEPELTDPIPLRKHISIQDQSTRLSFKRILTIYFGIGIALVVSFIDQTAVSTAAPVIGTDLGGSDSISWVGTAFFVANCALHLVYGRLSDIFGRKNMLQIAMFLLAFGNLLCGFAKTPIQLYVFRAIAGMGGGGINGMAMVIVSDIVPLKDRGKYQGFISAACSLGSAIGPFIGGALSSAGQWRWTFWLTTIFGACCLVIDHFILPLKPVSGSMTKKLGQIDYLGIALSASATVLLLVPISGGGTTFAWSSPTAIVLLVLGSLCAVGFIVGQWKFARLPILPLHMFKDLTTSIVMFQSFLIGIVYYANIYYIPIYLQYVLSYDAFMSGVFILVFTFPQTLWAILSGFYISKTNRYKIVILVGSGLWALGMGLQIMFGASSHIGFVLGILQLQSIGIGFSLQTTLIAALNTTAAPDRAVVTSARNFFRTMGGAFGLASKFRSRHLVDFLPPRSVILLHCHLKTLTPSL
ncbi:major facilitator superfamily domain-containing protein [Dioszegia hungarica]|uniref:Major facilitator superfamily domain-containing protein n=1 Tax=Dioszegia hungarica TaxID=4972 RepID=A0AA38H2Q2_9TREE|nr:major facilitator superfamily domain-containing protein [Dioszegia hungarica]KAI9631894.1 major facilitator superfamily domain-containing protein [Dioszegia hungarica]